MKKKIPYPGGLTLLSAVFVILILITFALLSFSGARQDLKNAQLTANRTAQYYQADLAARSRLADIELSLREIYASLPAPDSRTYFAECQKEFPEMQDNTLTFHTEMGASQKLQAAISLQFPQNDRDCFYKITQWQILSSESWNGDDSLPVYGHEG